MVPMAQLPAPELTVRYDGSAHTFVAGDDVVIGRDIHADVRIADPLISRAHLVLRFDQGRWVALDNDSLNGMFVHGRRMPVMDLEDGLNINVGSLVGPLLTFEVSQESAGQSSGVGGVGCGAAGQLAAHQRGPSTPPRREVESRDQSAQDWLAGHVCRGATGGGDHRPGHR